MDKNTKLLEELIKRVNILIAVSLECVGGKEAISTADKIVKLANIGVSSPDIARIIGKQTNYVTAILSQKKSKRKKLRRQ